MATLHVNINAIKVDAQKQHPTPAQLTASLDAVRSGRRPTLFLREDLTLQSGLADYLAYQQLGMTRLPCVIIK